MTTKDLFMSRFSCRRFLERSVEASLLGQVVETAQRVPSWGNTQPWKVYALAGPEAQTLRQRLVAAIGQGQPCDSDIPMPSGFQGQLMERYRDLGQALFKTLGIGREDTQRRMAHYANNFDAFGAPVLVYVTVPASQTPYVVFDAGGFVTGLCLAAAAHGLATCVLAALAYYPKEIRALLPIPQEELIVIGLALGYADPEAPANSFRSGRVDMDQVLTLRGFPNQP